MFTTAANLLSNNVEHSNTVTLAASQDVEQDCVTVGRYKLQRSALGDANGMACWDEAGRQWYCRQYSLAKLMVLSPLLFASIDRTNQPQEVCVVGQEAFLVYSGAYGDLHSHLRQRRKLGELEAAKYFRQIVELLCSAHANNIVLRDLKLKKFVFSDANR